MAGRRRTLADVWKAAPVMAATAWATNAAMIADVARLGYLRDDDHVLDSTFGRGRWWTQWRPAKLTTHDLKLDGVDFRYLPHPDGAFDAVAFDPPYKLNGTPSSDMDTAYGVDVVASWQGRHRLIREGITECARVVRPGGIVLVKCQNQVCSGAVRWQVDEFTTHAAGAGLRKIDELHMLGTSRPQPPRTRADGAESRQQHAHGRPSVLLVLRASA